MILVSDWRNWWKWYSTHPKLLGMVLTAAAGSMALAGGAAAWLDTFGLAIVLLIASGLFSVSFVGRLLQQGVWHKLRPADDDTDEAGA